MLSRTSSIDEHEDIWACSCGVRVDKKSSRARANRSFCGVVMTSMVPVWNTVPSILEPERTGENNVH